jgi:hypothetical protein
MSTIDTRTYMYPRDKYCCVMHTAQNNTQKSQRKKLSSGVWEDLNLRMHSLDVLC